MPPVAQPLNTSGSVTLDPSGAGTVELGPQAAETWQLSSAGITVPAASLSQPPTCQVYIGSSPTPGNFVDGTYTGQLNNTGKVAGAVIFPGQAIFAVFSGGTAGTIATLSIYGTRTRGYRGG
jgi:hypothetical protein